MGWKNVKQHYGIGHIVANFPEKGLCIGSAYCHDLILIVDAERRLEFHDTIDRRPTSIGCGLTVWRPVYLGRGEPFDGWVQRWSDNPAELRRQIDMPDTFERSVVVYTYDYDGNIIEKACEEPGWPNCTHDGLLMYENTFSTDRAEVVRWAKQNFLAAASNNRQVIREKEKDLARIRGYLDGHKRALLKLRRG